MSKGNSSSQSQPISGSVPLPAREAEPSAAETQRRILRHRLHMGDLGEGPVWDALAALDTLVTYGRWQIGPESLSHHPTLPSAIAAAQDGLDRALAFFSSEVPPIGSEQRDEGTFPPAEPLDHLSGEGSRESGK